MDVIEMTHPYLAVISASLDGKLRCFQQYKLHWVIDKSVTLKQLDYTPHNGAAILVTGF